MSERLSDECLAHLHAVAWDGDEEKYALAELIERRAADSKEEPVEPYSPNQASYDPGFVIYTTDGKEAIRFNADGSVEQDGKIIVSATGEFLSGESLCVDNDDIIGQTPKPLEGVELRRAVAMACPDACGFITEETADEMITNTAIFRPDTNPVHLAAACMAAPEVFRREYRVELWPTCIWIRNPGVYATNNPVVICRIIASYKRS